MWRREAKKVRRKKSRGRGMASQGGIISKQTAELMEEEEEKKLQKKKKSPVSFCMWLAYL